MRSTTLLVLVCVLVAPLATANAQDRHREHDDNGRHLGRGHERGRDRQQERIDAESRRQDAERAEIAAREAARQQYLAQLAAREQARQDYLAQQAAQEQARREQYRLAVLAAEQRAQQQELARVTAQGVWRAERAARHDAWLSATRERREQQLVLQRHRQRWVVINLQVSGEHRRHDWRGDDQSFESERRLAVRAELRRHSRRIAYLVRLREVAGESDEPEILARVSILFETEGRTHQRRMVRLGAAQDYPYGPEQQSR